MLHKLLLRHLNSSMLFCERTGVVRYSSKLASQMKLLNDSKQYKKALELFDSYKEHNIEKLSNLSIIQALKACAQIRDLDRGLNIHNLISSRTIKDLYVLTSLVHLYMQCGDLTNAQSLFSKSAGKTFAMYGAMMKGYIDNDMPAEAVDLFNQIQNPNEVLVILLFNAAAQLKNNETLNLIKKVCQEIPKEFYYNVRLLTSLLDALMKCGDVNYAEILFKNSKNKSLSMYGAMMKGYIINNLANEAIHLFKCINKPDQIVTTLLFNAAAQLKNNETLNLIKKVCQEIPKEFYYNVRLLTSLLDALMKCGDVNYAEILFKNSKNKSLSMYGAMMKGYITNNMANKAVDLFHKIKNPDEIVTNLLFKACAESATNEMLILVKKVSSQMPNSFYSNSHVLTSLLNSLMNCDDIAYAENLFNNSKNKSLSMYGAMMKGYIKNNMANKAIDCFNEIKKPDDVIFILLMNACAQLATNESLNLVQKIFKENSKSFYDNDRILTSLLDALTKCGDLPSANIIFSKMKKSVMGYSILMSGFLQEKKPTKVFELFNQMKNDNIQPDLIIYLHLIKASSQVANYSMSQSIVRKCPNYIFTENQIQNALIDMWGKTGCVDTAKTIFKSISRPNKTVFTSMINSYGLNGRGLEALELFHRLPAEFIDEITIVCVLNACSHSGLVDQARSIFNQIIIKTEKIYCTMIDCLSRAACFEEAQKLIDEFECFHQPARPMYMALLSGARNEKNIQLSEKVYDRMKQLFSGSTNSLVSAAILLANVYASTGNADYASDIRIELNRLGQKKKVGLSWTFVNEQLYEFRAHDQSHSRSSEIYAELEKISKELIERGHEYDSSWITRPISYDETVASVLCGHSEKLAIAWNFVANPSVSRIQITKNLRVCGDCHRATKLIAAIRQCEIIVRDANRIHHFHTSGQCSCNDYF